MRITVPIVFFAVSSILGWKFCFPTRESALPNFVKLWHEQVYSLDPGETLRFVAGPFSPEEVRSSSIRFPPSTGQVLYSTNDGSIRQQGWATATGTVESAVSWCMISPGPDMKLQQNLKA